MPKVLKLRPWLKKVQWPLLLPAELVFLSVQRVLLLPSEDEKSLTRKEKSLKKKVRPAKTRKHGCDESIEGATKEKGTKKVQKSKDMTYRGQKMLKEVRHVRWGHHDAATNDAIPTIDMQDIEHMFQLTKQSTT